MKDKTIRAEFPITVYGNLEKYNDVISKARCRIFYKGANRNGTYMSSEFAEKLIATAPYAPVKGIFSDTEGDYTDHGTSRNLGRIYGLVPAEPNFAWEKHMDDDGVEREYACVDVYLYTGLYSEARIIPGKSLSMELYGDSIKGDWKIINGKKYFAFEDASFLGLQALGDNIEPCFEGAAFFTTYNFVNDLLKQLEASKSTYTKTDEKF